MHVWIILSVLLVKVSDGTVQPFTGKCESEELMRCLSSSQANSGAGRIFFPDTQQRLREYCRHLIDGLDCSRRYIDDCVNEHDRSIYHNLTQDMVKMNVALCTPDSSFANRFLEHADCYKSLSDRFRGCSDRYIGNIVVVQSLAQEEQIKMTCCTVHEYSRCMRNAVDGRCEPDAQKLVEETVITALKRSFGYCRSLVNQVPTSDCLRTFSASKGHATDTLDGEYGGTQILTPTWVPFVLLLVSAFFVS